METYKDELAPWEKKKGYYKSIELGKDVFVQRVDIRNQIREMIASQIVLTSTTITSKKIIDEKIDSLAYDIRNIGNGIFGLKAAFEWGISEVVWQIEQNTKEFKELLRVLYASQDILIKDMRNEAQESYEKGDVANALEVYLELSQAFKNDFSVYISLGIICLFHEINKEKALDYFNKAAEIAKTQSGYYTSYALLYKALIVRDLNHIEDAAAFTKQAVEFTPTFTEAIYQNAQYNALLGKPDKAIPLLKEVIRDDIIYCLKINNELAFDGIRPHIAKIFEEIRVPQSENIKRKMKKFDKKINYFIDNIKYIHQQGYGISNNYNAKQLQENRDELAYMINYNSVLDTHIVDYGFSQLDISLNKDISSLIVDCNNIRNRLETKKREVSNKLSEVKRKNSFYHYFLYSLFSQVLAIPIGLSMRSSYGIYVLEAITFVACFFLVIIIPRAKWKKLYSDLQKREFKLEQIVKRIKEVLFK